MSEIIFNKNAMQMIKREKFINNLINNFLWLIMTEEKNKKIKIEILRVFCNK
jgi:hypothetical protein